MGGKVSCIDQKNFAEKYGSVSFFNNTIVDTFSERQRKLIEKGDIYLCLPGGVGTLSEIFDVLVENDIYHKNEKKDTRIIQKTIKLKCSFKKIDNFTPFLEKEEQFKYAVHELTLSHQKKNHWIWFLFPNLEKHGKSYYSKYFGLHDEREAELFYENETLRKRLFCLFEIVNTLLDTHSIDFIMGSVIDIIKFMSCIDLFYPLD